MESNELKRAPGSLDGHVALITGGGRGLGRAFAQALAAASAKIVVTARTERELDETHALITATGATARVFPADVTDRHTMEQVVDCVAEEFGPVDILVNNAAILMPLGYDWDIDPDTWWRTLEINLRGAYLCAHLVLPAMMQRRSGRIINVTSGGAHHGVPFGTAYCTSKAALSQWTNMLAAAVQEHGMSVFALAPTGPTAMLHMLATSPNVPKEASAFFRAMFEEGGSGIQDSVRLLMALVSGQADRLTGRHISYDDSIDDLLRRTDEIIEQDLYTLRLRV
jgi:NAD(P)-dependent dehydrogenase (short-subunit alcohol dehydrogenase family)